MQRILFVVAVVLLGGSLQSPTRSPATPAGSPVTPAGSPETPAGRSTTPAGRSTTPAGRPTTSAAEKWEQNILQNPPRLESDARKEGFVLLQDGCREDKQVNEEEGSPETRFVGRRYWKNSNARVVLIYDVNGILAGVQTAIPKDIFRRREDEDEEENEEIVTEEYGGPRPQRQSEPTFWTELKKSGEPRRTEITTHQVALASEEKLDAIKKAIIQMENKFLEPYRRFPTMYIVNKERELLDAIERANMQIEEARKREEDTTKSQTENVALKRSKRQMSVEPSLWALPSSTGSSAEFLEQYTLGNRDGEIMTKDLLVAIERAPIQIEVAKALAHFAQMLQDVVMETYERKSRPDHPFPDQQLRQARAISTGSNEFPQLDAFENPYGFSKEILDAANIAIAKEMIKKQINALYLFAEALKKSRQRRHALKGQKKSKHDRSHDAEGPKVAENKEKIILTMYFINPERVCNNDKARTIENIDYLGEGSEIFIQDKAEFEPFIKILRDEVKIRESELWKEVKCPETEGNTYFYQANDVKLKRRPFPIALNFNEGSLTVFAKLRIFDASLGNLEPQVEKIEKRQLEKKAPKEFKRCHLRPLMKINLKPGKQE